MGSKSLFNLIVYAIVALILVGMFIGSVAYFGVILLGGMY